LSKAIRELENEVGFTVFERNSRGAVPTEKGIKFLASARKILNEMENIKGLTDEENPERQSFSVSIPRASYIAEGFIRFAGELETHREININIHETNSMQTIGNVVENRFNLGIIRYQTVYENYFFNFIGGKDLNHDQLWEFEYLVIMPKAHPLAEAAEINFWDLKPFIEIVHGDTVIPYVKAADIRYPSSDDTPRKKIYLYERCNQFDLLSNLPQTYMWVSPVPERLLKLYGLVQRRCAFTNNHYRDALISRKNYRFTELDKKFLDKIFEARNGVSLKQYN
jgi:hypothetical protein